LALETRQLDAFEERIIHSLLPTHSQGGKMNASDLEQNQLPARWKISEPILGRWRYRGFGSRNDGL